MHAGDRDQSLGMGTAENEKRRAVQENVQTVGESESVSGCRVYKEGLQSKRATAGLLI